jgi:transketolase
MVNNANSGHPGMPLGCAPTIFVLYCMIMKYNFEEPLWNLRDRFILSNGHGCALLYSILYLTGYSYSKEDLQNFRQLHSKTPGHPEYNKSLGIEISTGPLGQGIANGVGMAIASKKQGINNTIYVMCGDGCLMEGISYEAASIAGHLELNNLVILYDDNGITIDGKTDVTFTEDVRKRFEALQWNVLEVSDGNNDIQDIFDKLTLAKNSTNKPTIIFIKTTIGYGSVAAGKSAVHGAPLGIKNTELLKEFFEMEKDKTFFVEDDVTEYFELLKNMKKEEYLLLEKNVINDNDKNVNNIDKVVEEIRNIKNEDKNYATRDSSNMVLRKIAELLPNVIVGSADLAESNKTLVTDPAIFISKDNFQAKYLHYGVREHAMCAIANGISTYDIIPIVSTFLVFITYCLAPIRMAALSKHKVLYVFTHDSVFLGEDGPTHQPIESLTILRSIPNLLTIRPCDTIEVSGAYQIALKNEGPTALIFSRQVLPNIENSSVENMEKGCYIVYEPEPEPEYNRDIELIIIATGSEVCLAIEVAKNTNVKCRVVSMPCCELFDKQDTNYKENVLPKNVKKMSLEAGSTLGWHKYADYTYGINTFGESAKINDIKEYFGFTLEKIKEFIKEKII